jgi:hypothetical protein
VPEPSVWTLHRDDTPFASVFEKRIRSPPGENLPERLVVIVPVALARDVTIPVATSRTRSSESAVPLAVGRPLGRDHDDLAVGGPLGRDTISPRSRPHASRRAAATHSSRPSIRIS